jgi:hypothetical protein
MAFENALRAEFEVELVRNVRSIKRPSEAAQVQNTSQARINRINFRVETRQLNVLATECVRTSCSSCSAWD